MAPAKASNKAPLHQKSKQLGLRKFFPIDPKSKANFKPSHKNSSSGVDDPEAAPFTTNKSDSQPELSPVISSGEAQCTATRSPVKHQFKEPAPPKKTSVPISSNSHDDSNASSISVASVADYSDPEERLDQNSSTEHVESPEKAKVLKKSSERFLSIAPAKWIHEKWFSDDFEFVNASRSQIRCKACGTIYRNEFRKSNFEDHLKTKQHIELLELSHQQKLPFTNSKSSVPKNSEAEARLSLFIAAHCSLNSSDHLLKVLRATIEGAENLKLARTKCAETLKNVWAPFFKDTLRHNMKDKKFSLMADETTNQSNEKILAIVVRYLTPSGEMKSAFLTLIKLKSGDACTITKAILSTLDEYELKVENMVAFAADNASTMCGLKSGVYARLKQLCPGLILVPCICHSIDLAVSAAVSSNIPSSIDELVRLTHNWFARSATRREEYKEFSKSTYCDEDEPPVIPGISGTRWLSIARAARRIDAQWDELEKYFKHHASQGKANRSGARILYDLYKVGCNRVFLKLIVEVIGDIESVNDAFQSNDVDIACLWQDLHTCYRALLRKLFVLPANCDAFNVDLNNPEFPRKSPCDLYPATKQYIDTTGFNEEQKIDLMTRIGQFFLELAKQIKSRLPSNIQILKNLSLFSPRNILDQNGQNVEHIFRAMLKEDAAFNRVMTQLEKIQASDWTNVSEMIPFWVEVRDRKNSRGDNPFAEIAGHVLNMLTLPVSNAEVERIFSLMAFIKDKKRNRMLLELTNAIILIRNQMKLAGKCCDSFPIPKEVMCLIGTNKIYGFKKSSVARKTNVTAFIDSLTPEEKEIINEGEQNESFDVEEECNEFDMIGLMEVLQEFETTCAKLGL